MAFNLTLDVADRFHPDLARVVKNPQNHRHHQMG